MKRRATIETGVDPFKREHRMDRNRLKGAEGDCFNAVLSAADMNFAKLLNLPEVGLCIGLDQLLKEKEYPRWRCNSI